MLPHPLALHSPAADVHRHPASDIGIGYIDILRSAAGGPSFCEFIRFSFERHPIGQPSGHLIALNPTVQLCGVFIFTSGLLIMFRSTWNCRGEPMDREYMEEKCAHLGKR